MDFDFNFLKCGVVGGLAGLAVDAIEYPVETIKTRIMASSLTEDLIKSTQKLSKFRGLSCQLLISFPYYFTFFVIYEGIRDRLTSSHTTNFFAALVGETVANILKNPLQLVKQQIMVGRSNKIGVLLSDVYKTLGIRGFYMGYAPALIRDVLFSATELPLYELFKDKISQRYKTSAQSPTVSALSGALAAIFSAIVSTPLDVIKTRHMTLNLNEVSSKNITSTSIAKLIYKESGVNGFFKGVWHRTGLNTAGAYIYFYAYASMKGSFSIKE